MSPLRQKIIDALNARGAMRPCSCCGKQKFALLDGFSRIHQQTDPSTVNLGGPTVPCAVVICENCGNVNLHALGALGLLSEFSQAEEKKNGGNNE